MSNETCNCLCCREGIEAPHEYHLERRPMPDNGMRAEFHAWVKDRGCDTDGAWSAWQGCWNLLHACGVVTGGEGQP